MCGLHEARWFGEVQNKYKLNAISYILSEKNGTVTQYLRMILKRFWKTRTTKRAETSEKYGYFSKLKFIDTGYFRYSLNILILEIHWKSCKLKEEWI